MNNGELSIIKEFESFLESHKTYRTKNVTHTSPDGSRYTFKGISYNDFLQKYCKLLENNPESKFVFRERPSKDNVTYLSVPIKFTQKVSNRLYGENHIEAIVKEANKIIISNFLVTHSELTSYVTIIPKPHKIKEKTYAEEIDIYYPELALPVHARCYVLKELSKKIIRKKVFSGIPMQKSLSEKNSPINYSVLAEEGALMYGCKREHYLTGIYDRFGDTIDYPEEYDYETIVGLLSNTRYNLDQCTRFRDVLISKKADFIYNNFLDKEADKYKVIDEPDDDSESDYYSDSESDTDADSYDSVDSDDSYDQRNKNHKNHKTRKNQKNSKSRNKKVKPRKDVRQHPEKVREIELAKRLMQIISRKRARNKKDWQRIGYALYSVSYTLFPIFKEFSAKNRRGFDITPQDVWRLAPKYCKNYSINTLRRWGFLDNKRKYQKILKEIYADLFAKSETCKHVDLAKLIHGLYRDRFVCVEIKSKASKWYEFQDHKWVVVQSAYTLEEIISEDVRSMLLSYCSDKLGEMAKKGHNYKSHEHNRYTKLMAGIDKLGDVGFRSDVVRACANKFFVSDFQSQLDTDPYLIGFENGVYDLNEMSFRDGMPSDMVSKTVGYDYEEYDMDDPIFEQILTFFSQVHTDEEMREYTLTFLASILRGKPDQKAHIWTGGGGNGKSATVDLVKRMIGDYFGVLPVTVITVKNKSSSNARPELADKFGKRFLVIQEPEHNDVVFVGQMKELTGEDTLHARPLYGDPFEFTPMFTIVLTCNNLPHIPSTDRGTWRRLRVTPFESEFVEANPVGPKQFLGDEELKEKFDSWIKPLVWLLLNKYYAIYKDGVNGKRYKIKEPELVKKYTNAYKKDSDFYVEFLDDNFNFTDNEEETETIQFVYDTFVAWYSSAYGSKPPPMKKFKEYLKKNKIKHDKREIKGIQYALSLQ